MSFVSTMVKLWAATQAESVQINCNTSTVIVYATDDCTRDPPVVKFEGPVGNCTPIFTQDIQLYGTIGCGVEPDETTE